MVDLSVPVPELLAVVMLIFVAVTPMNEYPSPTVWT
jgi:hypothetical protein